LKRCSILWDSRKKTQPLDDLFMELRCYFISCLDPHKIAFVFIS